MTIELTASWLSLAAIEKARGEWNSLTAQPRTASGGGHTHGGEAGCLHLDGRIEIPAPERTPRRTPPAGVQPAHGTPPTAGLPDKPARVPKDRTHPRRLQRRPKRKHQTGAKGRTAILTK